MRFPELVVGLLAVTQIFPSSDHKRYAFHAKILDVRLVLPGVEAALLMFASRLKALVLHQRKRVCANGHEKVALCWPQHVVSIGVLGPASHSQIGRSREDPALASAQETVARDLGLRPPQDVLLSIVVHAGAR